MRNRIGTLSICLLAAAFMATTACKKDDDKKAKTNSAKKGTKGETADKKEGDKKEGDTKEGDTKTAAKKAPADLGSMSKEQVAEAFIGMVGKLAAVATGAEGDCDKAAANFNKIIDANLKLIEKGKAYDKDPAMKKWFDENYKSKADAAFKGIMPLMKKCHENKDFEKAFKRMM